MSSTNPPVSLSPALGLQGHAAGPVFDMRGGKQPGLGLHACVASTLKPIVPSPETDCVCKTILISVAFLEQI